MIDNLDALLRDGNTTFPKLLQHWAQRFPDALAFREKDYGIWNWMTWQHYFETARRFALWNFPILMGQHDRRHYLRLRR